MEYAHKILCVLNWRMVMLVGGTRTKVTSSRHKYDVSDGNVPTIAVREQQNQEHRCSGRHWSPKMMVQQPIH